jgi:hypothetical protein
MNESSVLGFLHEIEVNLHNISNRLVKNDKTRSYLREDIVICGLTFRNTSYSHPEQYNIFNRRNQQVGAMSVMFDRLTCHYNNWKSDCRYLKNKYTLTIKCKGVNGEFNSKIERYYYMKQLANNIKRPQFVSYIIKLLKKIKIKKH